MIVHKCQQSAAQSCSRTFELRVLPFGKTSGAKLLNFISCHLSDVFPLLEGSGKTMAFENRRGKYKEIGKKVLQAYRAYVEETFLPCDAGDSRIFVNVELDTEMGLYYYGAGYLDPKYSRWLSGDPAITDYMSGSSVGEGGIYNSVNFNAYHYGGNNPVKYVDPDGEASILMRQIDAGLNAKYDSGHVLGKYFDFAKHSLIDYGTLKSFRDSGGLIHQLGKKLGIVNREVTKNDQYIIKYTNMDDDITKQAVENVLGMERFGGRLEDGKHNNDSAKQKYKILINDCNAFTRAVFKEYKKLWKENWKKENKSTSRYQAWKAWRKHYKEISARRNEEIQIKH